MEQIVKFLRELQCHNTTEWFHAHKNEYKVVRAKFNEFALKLMAGMAEIDPSTKGLELKDCTYRINRDIRFSADKSPYKTHFGVFIAPGGKKSGKAGYYFHLSVGGEGGYPEDSLLAIGHYCYDKKVVELVREDIADEGEKFDAMVKVAEADGFHFDTDNRLKKVPRGFDVPDQYADYMRLKTYCLDKPLNESFLYDENLLENILQLFKKNVPFVNYLNQIIDYVREEE